MGIQERVKTFIANNEIDGYFREESYDEVLPAKDLGIDEGANYERLLEILDGDEITPEDYEILLQLDTNNKKSTLSEDTLNEIPILVIGDKGEDRIPREEIGSSKCDICIEAWEDLE